MALKLPRSTHTIIFTLILFLSSIPTGNAQALADDFLAAPPSSLEAFVNEVRNGQAGELRGIYVPEVLAAHVVQQPTGRNDFVSSWANILTQFGLASKFGSTGLLAHNYLAGESFARLEKGQEIYLVYGDGQISMFVVADMLQYQALELASPSSNFLDLENGDLLTASELFSNIYDQPGKLILQTCISRANNQSWGRLFVVAEPYIH